LDKVAIVLPESIVAGMQIKRLNGYEKITFVNTLEEVLEA